MSKFTDPVYLNSDQYRNSATFSQLEQELTAELQAKGAIHITKDSGLFVARKRETFSEFFRKSPLSGFDLPSRHDRG